MSGHVSGEFVLGFANAAVKIRKAVDANEGVTLDVSETKALMDALKSLSSKPAGGAPVTPEQEPPLHGVGEGGK